MVAQAPLPNQTRAQFSLRMTVMGDGVVDSGANLMDCPVQSCPSTVF